MKLSEKVDLTAYCGLYSKKFSVGSWFTDCEEKR